MNNVNAISESRSKGNYIVNYANAQTFNGNSKVSLDTPVDTFAKQNNKQNKHTALKIITGVAVGLAAIFGTAYVGGIASLAKLKNISWKEARVLLHREAMAKTNFIIKYKSSKLIKNVDGVFMLDNKPFTGKTDILGLKLPESVVKNNKHLKIVQNIVNGKMKSVAIVNPHESGQYFIAKLSKSGDKFKIKSNLSVDSKETASLLQNFFKDTLLPEAKKYI